MERKMKTLLVFLCLSMVFSSLTFAAEKEKEKEELFTLKNKDIDIRDALQMIARAAKVNVVFSKDVRGKIAVELTDVPYMKAMEAIALTNKLVVHEFDKKSKIFLVLRHDDAESIIRYKMMKRRQAQRRRWEKQSKGQGRGWSRGRSGGGAGFWTPPATGGGSGGGGQGGGQGNTWQDYAPDEEEGE